MLLAHAPTTLLLALAGCHRAIEWRFGRRASKCRSAFYAEVWRDAAAALGAKVTHLGDEILEIRHGTSCTRVRENVTEIDDVMTALLANNKPVVHRLLAERGLRVPKYIVFSLESISKAVVFAEEFGGAWVVKPAANSSGGLGVTTGISRPSDIFWAAVRAGGYGLNILLEQEAEGDVYRLLYLDGVLLDAVLRKPAVVVGDGKSSIRKLLQRENEKRMIAGPKHSQAFLSVNMDMRRTLAHQGFSLSSVPKEGTQIALNKVVNANSSAENAPAGHLLCEAIIEDGATAAAAIGVRFAGVDVVTRDPSVPLAQSGGVFLEVNTRPGFHHHYYRQGEPCRVAGHLLPYLLEEHRASRNLPLDSLGRAGPELICNE